jgi:oligosaccharyltransferase complex subunit beta
MLDPYIRSNLTVGSSSPGIFKTTVKLPDVYGVFTFKTEYKRHGFSWIEAKETVSIHPFRHDEYPRFLSAAFPYYVNSFSMIASFFVLSVVVLYYKPAEKDAQGKVKTKTQ